MANSSEQTGAGLTYMQRVGQVVDAIMEAYTASQIQLNERDRALSRVLASSVVLGEAEDPFAPEGTESRSLGPRKQTLSDNEIDQLEFERDRARLEYDRMEDEFGRASAASKQYLGGLLLGRTIDIRLREQYRQFQWRGQDKATPMPQEFSGRFTGYDPSSAMLRLRTDDETFSVRLFVPDFSTPGKVNYAAIITAIDFPEQSAEAQNE